MDIIVTADNNDPPSEQSTVEGIKRIARTHSGCRLTSRQIVRW
ncbi:MAG TPA: hypothetical protein VKB86_19600 [Pyrinomonadaceae bacterium]|nr:hypothetical protein [Pyrinomonadaceae bacterium]